MTPGASPGCEQRKPRRVSHSNETGGFGTLLADTNLPLLYNRKFCTPHQPWISGEKMMLHSWPNIAMSARQVFFATDAHLLPQSFQFPVLGILDHVLERLCSAVRRVNEHARSRRGVQHLALVISSPLFRSHTPPQHK